jgi:hypothetical protein
VKTVLFLGGYGSILNGTGNLVSALSKLRDFSRGLYTPNHSPPPSRNATELGYCNQNLELKTETIPVFEVNRMLTEILYKLLVKNKPTKGTKIETYT